MSMTKEEAIKWLEEIVQDTDTYWGSCSEALQKELDVQKEVFLLALSALRPITREQVEKMWRGEWIGDNDEKVGTIDGSPIKSSTCSACGNWLVGSDEYGCAGYFCPSCGRAMTDKAVDMVMERLEEVQNDQ